MYLVPIATDDGLQIPAVETIRQYQVVRRGVGPTVSDALAGMNEAAALLAVCSADDAEVCGEMIRQGLNAGFTAASSGRLACFRAETIPEDLRVSLPAAVLPYCRRLDGELLLVSREALSTLDPAGPLTDSLWGQLSEAVAFPQSPGLESLPAAVAKRPALRLRTVTAVAGRLAVQLRQDEYGADCLGAGLLLLHDYLDDSHQLSQRNEGSGRPRTADYWHGIMHRREPDAGNAAYWFRRVGSHPILQEIGDSLETWIRQLQLGPAVGARAAVLTGAGGVLDPFRLIELSTEVLRTADPVADLTLRIVQYLEMLTLLRFGLRQSESE